MSDPMYSLRKALDHAERQASRHHPPPPWRSNEKPPPSVGLRPGSASGLLAVPARRAADPALQRPRSAQRVDRSGWAPQWKPQREANDSEQREPPRSHADQPLLVCADL